LFTRADVRLDFPLGNRSWGGSIDPSFACLPAVGFSAQWAGQLVPAFSETYTLNLGADGVAQLYLRPSGSTNYKLVVDTRTGVVSGTYAFTAGQLYDVKVQYSCSTGPSALSLSWSSPSVKPEIIEPVRQIGLVMHSWSPTIATHYTPVLQAVAPYTVLRFMDDTNGNIEQNWSDRTTPTSGYRRSWEYIVMTANAMGKDLYLTIPEMASGSDPSDTKSYIYQLANLLKNGSTDPTGQYYPPLNPNLKVYVEYSNEVWNASFPQWRQNFCSAYASIGIARPEYGNCRGAFPGNPADAPILLFDGNKDGNILSNRRHALRLVQTSNIFRGVFGDAAMGSRVRILDEFQLDNQGWPPTAQSQLDFIDEYFNNGDGTRHVSTPHPVNYYLWGGGGANYFHDSIEAAGGTETSISQIFGTCRLNALWPLTVDCTSIPDVRTNGGSYQQQMNGEASWAARYGLYEVSYEGGWGLGGDSFGTAVENSAKFNNPGPCVAGSSVNCTEGTQNKMIQMFDLSGGGITVLGTYSQWSALVNFASSPLRQAVIDSSHFPRALPSNGVRLPQTLGSGNLTLSVNAHSMQISPNCGGNSHSCNSWLEWTVIAPVSGSYTLTPSFSTGGTAAVLVDGQVIGNAASSSGVAIQLTQGLHSITVQAFSGSVTVSSIAVASP
jgi:hypothetical protein